MAIVVYLDETGDHSLENEDKDFPVFAIVMFICEIEHYINTIVPLVYRLKLDYWGHEGAILHSRDIRKAQGEFTFLRNVDERPEFYRRINEIMDQDYALIACAIRKQNHRERYGINAQNPYDLSLMFALERLLFYLEEINQAEVTIIAESRGKVEDNALKLSFLTTINEGTKFVNASRFKARRFRLEFIPKERNIVGTQLADLAAYPFARWVLDPIKSHPSYPLIEKRCYRKKVFP